VITALFGLTMLRLARPGRSRRGLEGLGETSSPAQPDHGKSS
jgi:hypothetical protein